MSAKENPFSTPRSLGGIKIPRGIRILFLDLDGTLWNNLYNPQRHPPYRKASPTAVVSSEGEVIRLKDGILQLLERARKRGILVSIASKNDYASIRPLVEAFDLPIQFFRPQIAWKEKDELILEATANLKPPISEQEIMFVDDIPDNLLRVHNRFPRAHLVKTP